jgi:hypothetical protein
MAQTIRLWTAEELLAAKTGSNLWLSTLLLNSKTLSEDMAKAYPYDLRKTYIADWQQDGEEPVTIYAPNDEMVLKFIDGDYICFPETLCEAITTYRDVELPA